ncbi:hypothetical protein B0H16DRAFT_1484647 [Mycena metata]|uniref:Uncharacterized protein n=1 Tax=Mycena metata TaxID=1033252 RepID=A0AAD7DUA1_9AGAR|nr:hypothetical protein B0H16DRAFT_1484647 [Mycena metata]
MGLIPSNQNPYAVPAATRTAAGEHSYCCTIVFPLCRRGRGFTNLKSNPFLSSPMRQRTSIKIMLVSSNIIPRRWNAPSYGLLHMGSRWGRARGVCRGVGSVFAHGCVLLPPLPSPPHTHDTGSSKPTLGGDLPRSAASAGFPHSVGDGTGARERGGVLSEEECGRRRFFFALTVILRHPISFTGIHLTAPPIELDLIGTNIHTSQSPLATFSIHLTLRSPLYPPSTYPVSGGVWEKSNSIRKCGSISVQCRALAEMCRVSCLRAAWVEQIDRQIFSTMEACVVAATIPRRRGILRPVRFQLNATIIFSDNPPNTAAEH